MKRFIAGALVVLLPVGAAAQDGLPPQRCLSDSTAHVDTLDLTFLVRAYRGQSSRPDPVLTSAFGAMIGPGLTLPPTITAIFFPYVYGRKEGVPLLGWPFGTLLVSVAGPTDIDMLWDSASTPKDSASKSVLMQAVPTAATAKALQDLADRVGWASLQTVRLKFFAGLDSGVRVPLAKMHVPMVREDTPMFAKGASVNMPKGVNGAVSEEVRLRYLVDETGHVPLASVSVLEASDRRFVAEAINAVRSQKFTPAKSGRCALMQIVDQTVKFNQGGA